MARSLLRPAALALLCIACAGSSPSGGKPDNYLKWVSFEVPVNEHVLLRWRDRAMPLKVFLSEPPEGLFDDPRAIHDSVKDGVVDDIGEADIPIVWESDPNGAWFIAQCVYDVQQMARRFGVARILVTGRFAPDVVADLFDVHAAVLHEMGHALGLGGHSPDPGDIMSPSISRMATDGLSDRDRATLRALYARPVGARISGTRRVP